jgi:hypothetical protein
MSDFKQYVRTNIAEMTPWTEDMDTTNISISKEDIEAGSPKKGDMIARNPENYKDQWLVAAKYFENNFEELPENGLVVEEALPPSLIEVGSVFPSDEISVWVLPDEDYGGAHEYYFMSSLGHVDGQPVYKDGEVSRISFVKKEESGMVAGLQSEQLLIALLDRHRKLNAKYPSSNGEMMILHIERALLSLKARVQDRLSRGVMGELKK